MGDKYSDNQQNIRQDVSRLMSDIPNEGQSRRQRDAQRIDEIRKRQNTVSAKKGVLQRLKSAFGKKENAAVQAQNQRVIAAYYDEADTEVMDDEADTEIMDEEPDTEIMDETHVYVLEFNDLGNRFSVKLGSGSIYIGCKDGCDVVLKSRHVSRKHAQLSCEHGELYIRDCGSTNGTYINKELERLAKDKPYLLKDGDTVTIADIEFYVREM